MTNIIKVETKEGLLGGVISSYKSFSSSYVRQRQTLSSERKILAYCFLVSFLLFMGKLPNQVARWVEAQNEEPLYALVLIAIFTALFFVPLVLYLVSGIIHLFAKLFRGMGTYRDVRLALFWSLIVCSPVIIVNGLMQGYFIGSQIALTVNWFSNVFIAWVFSIMLREAEGFISSGSVFVVIISVVIFVQIVTAL